MPTPIVFEDQTLAADETFKGFDSTDSLGKSYLEMNNRVKSGNIDLLPEEMRKDPAIAPFKTIPDLARSYVETKKMVGSIEKAPEKADGYKFTQLSGLHANVKPEGIQKELMGIAHKAGLGNKSADIVQQEVLGLLSARMVQQETARKDLIMKNETALRQEWGADYDAKFDKIVKVMIAAGGAEGMADTAGISQAMNGSPTFMKMMGKLVGMLSEDSINSLGEGADKPITDATGAQAEINKYNTEILSQGPKHPFNDERNAGHDAAKKKMADLFKMAYPS